MQKLNENQVIIVSGGVFICECRMSEGNAYGTIEAVDDNLKISLYV